jgi:iron complex outermembrane receptor protein
MFELYSTRFGTATPNPDLGPERATNLELGWKGAPVRQINIEATAFFSRVRDLIQTIVLPDTTTQANNVGEGRFYGIELAVNLQPLDQLAVGGNYTALRRTIHDALLPALRPTGVPSHKGFLYASWQPMQRLSIRPTFDLASDRWSDVNPAPEFPYVRTGAYTLFDLAAEVTVVQNAAVVLGIKNLSDQDYATAWGFPQPGRTFFAKVRISH